MFQSVSRGSKGAVEYFVYGHRKDMEYTRNERDKVVPVYGDLNEVKRVQKYLETQKNQSDNYLHVVISYSKNDMTKMTKMTEKEKAQFKHEMVKKVIQHHTSGYDLEAQVTAYAETHFPKIKNLPDENGEVKERLEHEHILIMLHDKISNARLRNTFHNDEFIDHSFICYLNEMYDMDKPLSTPNSQRKTFNNASKKHEKGSRKYYLEELKNIKSYPELLEYFKDNNTNWKLTKYGKSKKITIINEDKSKINLVSSTNKNLHFNHIQYLLENRNKNVPSELMPVKNARKNIEDMKIEELEKILKSYYKDRFDYVFNKRHSKKTKEILEKIYQKRGLEVSKENLKEVVISQFKMFQKDEHFEVEKPQIKIKKQEKLNGKYNLYQPTYREIRGRKTKDDLRELSSINLLHSAKSRTGVLLSADEQYRLREKPKTDYGLQSTTNRDVETRERGTGIGGFVTLQNKLFFEKYHRLTSVILKGYWFDARSKNPRLGNKEKNIYIEDKGDKITSNRDLNNTKERVQIMLDMAVAKNWKLSTLNITGSKIFKKEMQKQINIRLKKQRIEFEKLHKKPTIFASLKKLLRPKNVLEEVAKKTKEKIVVKKVDLEALKKSLRAEDLLKMAVEKYKLRGNDYETTGDNKINNKTNRQKPKNVIDFLQKEVGMGTREAVENCITLFKEKSKVQEVKKFEDKKITYLEERIQAVKENVHLYRNQFGKPNPKLLHQVDYEKLDKLKIETLAKLFEDNKTYHHLSSDKMHFAYDAQNDIVFNSLDYLKYQYETEKMEEILEKLQELTGVSFVTVNKEAVKVAVREGIAKSKTLTGVQNHISTKFKEPTVKFIGDELKIGKDKIKLSEIDYSPEKIKEELRELQKTKQKTLILEK